MMNTIEFTRQQLEHLLSDKLATHFTIDIYESGKVQVSSHIRSVDGMSEGWVPVTEDEKDFEPVIRAACDAMGVTYADIVRSAKNRIVTDARCIIAAKVYRNNMRPMPLPRVGRLLRRNHSTVIHLVRRYDNYMKYDKDFRRAVERYKKALEKYTFND